MKQYMVVNPASGQFCARERKGIIIGSNFRAKILRKMEHETALLMYVNIPELEKEKELCIWLNKNQGGERQLAAYSPRGAVNSEQITFAAD